MKSLVAMAIGSLVWCAAPAQNAAPAAPPAGGAPAAAGAGAVRISSVEAEVFIIKPLAPSERLPAKAGDLLETGDQIVAGANGAELRLDCANGASQTLTGAFDALIDASDATALCAIVLNAGTAVATSNPAAGDAGRAAIRGGPIAAESQHTQFGVTVPAHAPDDAEAFVIEGEANVVRAGTRRKLTDGQLFSARALRITAIPDEQYRTLAATFARIDAGRIGAAGETKAQAQVALATKYYLAFKAPKDLKAREDLTTEYRRLSVPESSVTRYAMTKEVSMRSLFASATIHDAVAAVATTPQPKLTLPESIKPYVAIGEARSPREFPNPTVKGSRLDLCLHWGSECGQPAADAFCKRSGFTGASTYSVAADIGAQTPTLVLGDGAVCAAAACDGFASITCR